MSPKKRKGSVADRGATIQQLWHVLLMLLKQGRWEGIPLLDCDLWHVSHYGWVGHSSTFNTFKLMNCSHEWRSVGRLIYSLSCCILQKCYLIVQPHGGWRNANGSIIAFKYVTFLDAMNGNKPCFGEATLHGSREGFHQKLSLDPCTTWWPHSFCPSIHLAILCHIIQSEVMG